MTQTPSAKPQKKRDPRLTMLLDGLKRIFIHNWPTKLLALLLAIILWGGLITQDHQSAHLPVHHLRQIR